MFYVMKNNVANIISGDLPTQLGLLILHNETTSTANSPALSTNSTILDNDSKKSYRKAFK